MRLLPRLVNACGASADPDRALAQFERLVAALPHPNMFYHYLLEVPRCLDLLVKIFVHSQSLSDTLTRNAAYFHFLISPETLGAGRTKAKVRAELARLLLAGRSPAEQYDIIRRFRRREMLRIAACDLASVATLEQTMLDLSNLADVCLDAVFEIALRKKARELRLDPSLVGQLALIGMGKLGGQELNYSSDVDLIFVFDEDGVLRPGLTRREFYTKLAEEIVSGVGRQTEEGTIFRVDLRLRPEGAYGPLVCSLQDCESYYAERGETWERMALLKARAVAGDVAVGEKFLELVEPFVYRRHVGENVLQQMAAIKTRIEHESVHRGELTRHVKLGIGGIREIEFIIQSLQLLRAGSLPWLRERNSLRALPLLQKAGLLTHAEEQALGAAYRFLRVVEHRLQMEMDLQTHTIPDEERALRRLAHNLGFSSVKKFLKVHTGHTGRVRQIYRGMLASVEQSAVATSSQLTEEQLATHLKEAGFGDVMAATQRVARLLHGSGVAYVSSRTKELFAVVLRHLLDFCRQLADPDAALLHFEKFVEAYGSRALLYELFVRHPKLVEMLLRLGDGSRHFSEVLQREPDLFDELCRGARLEQRKTAEQLREELSTVVAQRAEISPMNVVRRWKCAEMLRVALGDLMGLLDTESVQREVTTVAEVSLQFALAQARRQTRLDGLEFAVIGMGKFGGWELGYGADLDVLFVGEKQDDAVRLATQLVESMAACTEAGTLFVLDARLRPDGEHGVLALPVHAYCDYYLHRARAWERLALTRARFVAGTENIGQEFIKAIHRIIYAGPISDAELAEIRRVRRRIEAERGDQLHRELEFKTGPGGLVDVEFLVQVFQLRYGHAWPELRAPSTLTVLQVLRSRGVVREEDAAALREHYLFLRRIESVLRRAENADVSHLPHDERELTLLSKRLGFTGADAFLDAYRHATRSVREIYSRLVG
ncbi:MAG: bifunctional [glutamate--ammonia ligase]-adenylyl-L-tyrosine phosphorylase/[glutamate--ammonia-ligase] adenylyltransferase [Verrucomicrobiae bacterium]|nr:bifunctional [glutamate--ammonia ligase]-adenylyl-L-tyrosine phosphorylase/[glutamate--ammonia-ligase] adenylyltransferase [Verrucomicrobiae bacterium]